MNEKYMRWYANTAFFIGISLILVTGIHLWDWPFIAFVGGGGMVASAFSVYADLAWYDEVNR